MAIIHQQIILALGDVEGLSRKEAVGLEGAARQMLTVAAVAEILQARRAGDSEVDG